MEKGRDKNEPSGSKTGPVWNRIKLKQTDPCISPPQKSNQITLNQSESNRIKVRAHIKMRVPPDRTPHSANFQPIPPYSPGHRALSFSIRRSMFLFVPPSHSFATSFVLDRAQSCQGASHDRFPLDVGYWMFGVGCSPSPFAVRCSLKHLLHSSP